MLNRRLPMVDPSRFAMVPRSDVPRSTFKVEFARKSTFDTSYLVPFYLDEVLPGDVHKGNVQYLRPTFKPAVPPDGQRRMSRPSSSSFPTVWFGQIGSSSWGNRPTPAIRSPTLSRSFDSPAGGFVVGGIADHLGLPTVGQVTARANGHGLGAALQGLQPHLQ